jgi:hypothetical protein
VTGLFAWRTILGPFATFLEGHRSSRCHPRRLVLRSCACPRCFCLRPRIYRLRQSHGTLNSGLLVLLVLLVLPVLVLMLLVLVLETTQKAKEKLAVDARIQRMLVR